MLFEEPLPRLCNYVFIISDGLLPSTTIKELSIKLKNLLPLNLVQILCITNYMLNISRDIHSLSSFKRNTPSFIEQMKQTGEPVVLTVNGKAEIVVQDAESYQKLLDALERLEAIAGIKQGLEDVEAGRTISMTEFEQEMRQKYDISS